MCQITIFNFFTLGWKVGDNCFVHPIFVFLFLVTFGDEVTKNTKILHNLCLHFARQDGQDGKKNGGKKITQHKWPKYPKPKKQKYGMKETNETLFKEINKVRHFLKLSHLYTVLLATGVRLAKISLINLLLKGFCFVFEWNQKVMFLYSLNFIKFLVVWSYGFKYWSIVW